MKAIILAAGSGTRLYPLTLNRPKPLLTVADKPIVEHSVNRLLPIRDLDHIYVAINGNYTDQFQEWLENYRSRGAGPSANTVSNIAVDARDNAGAISSLYSVLTSERIDEDIIVIAADNLFSHGLEDFVDFAQGKDAPVVAVYDLENFEEGKKYGSVVADDDGKIVSFTEKPAQPKSTVIGVALYYYPKLTLPLILKYVDEGNHLEHIGLLVEWMHTFQPFYTWRVPEIWFDVGSQDALEAADRFFTKAFKGEAQISPTSP